MTDPELQELADLWQEADASEAAAFEAAARRARRQGRLLAYGDLAWAVLLIGGSLFAALMAPGPGTTAAALFLLVATVWLTWKRRKIRQMSRTLDTSDRQSFLASSVRNARGDLRRVTLSMIVFPFLVPMALLVKVSFRTGSDIAHPLDVLTEWAQSTRGIFTLCLFAIIMGFTYRSRRKIKAELRRLEDMRRAYAEQADLEDVAGD
jgi:hypothetical protein